MILCRISVREGIRPKMMIFLLLVSGLAAHAANPKDINSDPNAVFTNVIKEEQALLKTIQGVRDGSPAIQASGKSGDSSKKTDAVLKEQQVLPAAAKADDYQAFSRKVFLETTMMPEGGNYAASSHAMGQLKKSIFLTPSGKLQVDAQAAKPSFCSSATYLVLLSVLAEMQELGDLPYQKPLSERLLVHGQADGVGVWGRWNANGPGTAMLVKELGMGENFVDIKKAIPGDFLKIWWSKEVGAKEHGHSVVYLGTRTDTTGVSHLKFWSSNIPGGYGVKEVPMSKVKTLLFSRITNPCAIQNLGNLKQTNEFLASMTSKTVSIDDVKKELSIK